MKTGDCDSKENRKSPFVSQAAWCA
eukprot:COSAG04_NODE_20518_length_391_cov_1.976027_1_plen_24_part_01